ncbi:diphosphate--fructose-6-phosphate 1-phosphotransferase [Candidatus Woesearchaeota archaeon]|nr:diphosphate--fructose-6-phosphate 1-phosphotransferase [Candidatus Woesearchaeota archaeon]
MGKSKRRVVWTMSGGPTRVKNRTFVAAINEAYQHQDEIPEFWGAVNGPVGVLRGKFMDLYQISPGLLRRVAHTPGSALGSTRKKFKKGDITPEEFAKALMTHEITDYVVQGGNGSAAAAIKIKQIAQEAGYELRVYHVPKTIDNDLVGSDHTPGYGSAARYVILRTMGDDTDTHSLPGVKINVVQGRDAGWLAASSRLAREFGSDSPHLIYVPEVSFYTDKFLEDIAEIAGRYGRAVVTVAEGIRYHDGNMVASEIGGNGNGNGNGEKGKAKLAHYLEDLAQDNMGSDIRVRSDTFGYSSRTMPGVVSEQDGIEADMVGGRVIELVLAKADGQSVTLQRGSDLFGYIPVIGSISLEEIAGRTRQLDKRSIAQSGNDINATFVEYIRPLVGEIPPLGKLNLTDTI